MRASIIAATLAGALGVTAHDKALENALSFLRRSGCGELDGCGKHSKGSYIPDGKTFVFPDKGYEHGNRWELINKQPHHGHHHGHHGHHHDLHSYVNFDFREESLIFEFEKIEDYGHVKTKEKLRYEEIEIKVAVEKAHFDNARRYSLKDGHCHEHDGRYRCRLPYNDLVQGGHHGLCHDKEKYGKELFVKIETVVVAGEERYELCNRGGKEKEYFRLRYACTECKYEEYEKDCHHKPHHHHHHDKHHKCCHNKHHDHKHHDHKCCHDHKHHDHKHHDHKCCHDHKHHDHKHHDHKCCHDHKHHDHHKYHKHHDHKHHDHGCGCKKYHHPHGPRDMEAPAVEVRDVETTAVETRDLAYECTGAFLEAYGTGKYSHPLQDIGCPNYGYYHRYPKKELEVSVHGPIELKGHTFGHFSVKLDKRREDVILAIDVNVHDPQYFVTEIAAIIVCEDGLKQKEKDICTPSSYPYRRHDKHGLNHFHFDVVDEFQCKGDYFIAVYVLVCVAEDKCEYKKVGYGYDY
ncbi:unnamed protein product [Clonostachys rosea]|uniref:Uncharacterized protein n=1 Tax=Bionectria ochroleuca TaxID=29856 RepID=A0ABY6UYU3_BIOOC|nr:unnamed protein product [Clonostachys rosea]